METELNEPRFASLGALFAYHYREDGPEVLKVILAELLKDGDSRRERMERVACELKALHLNKAANLVREAAKECLSITDMADCPYLHPRYTADERANALNIACWQRSQENIAKRIRQECQELLRKGGIDRDWIDRASNSD